MSHADHIRHELSVLANDIDQLTSTARDLEKEIPDSWCDADGRWCDAATALDRALDHLMDARHQVEKALERAAVKESV